MRFALIACLAGMLLFAGCSSDADTEAQRGSTQEDGSSASESSTAPDEESGQREADLGNEVKLAAITLIAPESWIRKAPSSSFVEAEFALPAAKEDGDDGRLTVSIAGGSIEANIERWKGQFGGAPESKSQEKIEIDGIEATLVDFTGEFDDRRGPFAPGSKRPDYRMIAAIIPVDGQLHFVKAVGPKETMAAHADEIQAFVRSVKRN